MSIGESKFIHMNGRAYDYNLGRFLSVDPFIQAPGNSQSMNPYSYIMNNPLSGTDPSGYMAERGDFIASISIGIFFSEEDANKVSEVENNISHTPGDITSGIEQGKAIKNVLVTGTAVSAAVMLSKGFKRKKRHKSNSTTKRSTDNGNSKEIKANQNRTEQIGSNGTRKVADVQVKRTPNQQRAALEESGYKGENVTNKSGSERGTKHIISKKKMEVRVMDGNDKNKPRIVTSSEKNPNQKVDSETGKPFKNNMPKEEQYKRSHIELEKDK